MQESPLKLTDTLNLKSIDIVIITVQKVLDGIDAARLPWLALVRLVYNKIFDRLINEGLLSYEDLSYDHGLSLVCPSV